MIDIKDRSITAADLHCRRAGKKSFLLNKSVYVSLAPIGVSIVSI